MTAQQRHALVEEIVTKVREAQAPPATLLRMRDVCERTSLSDTFIYELIGKGEFPKSAVCLGAGGRGVRWNSNEVQAWIDNKLQTPRASNSAAEVPATANRHGERSAHSAAGRHIRKKAS